MVIWDKILQMLLVKTLKPAIGRRILVFGWVHPKYDETWLGTGAYQQGFGLNCTLGSIFVYSISRWDFFRSSKNSATDPGGSTVFAGYVDNTGSISKSFFRELNGKSYFQTRDRLKRTPATYGGYV